MKGFELVDKIIKNKIEYKKIQDYYKEFNEDATENSEIKFIWGIKSVCDSSPKPNLLTMNDFEILYFKRENKYGLSVETMFSFENSYKDEKKYLESLLDEFSNWMIKEGYSINSILPQGDMYSIFTSGYNINTHFNTIEDAYRTFYILVKGY